MQPNFIQLLFFIVLLSNSVFSQSIFRSVCQGHIGRVDSLINESSAQIDQQDQYGNTPLHFIVYCKKVEVIKRLLERMASVDAMDNHGRTPLFMENTFSLPVGESGQVIYIG
jgi:ankyrin repeat protein